ncbi:MAG TPA: hypothetical protein ENI05_04015 [Porticoccus sp.]|nr:hypothetical protein [Porticoccus sp.]
MTASAGTTTTTIDKRSGTLNNLQVWEKITVFSIISGDTTGAATVLLNGIIQKIIVKITDFTTGDGSVDVSLTDNGDNTIFSVTNLADPATHVFSVSESIASEVNIILGFTDPTAAETVTVTLRGI